jgi:hypothetical protein
MLEWLRHGSTTVTSHGSAMDSISGLGGSPTGPTNVTAHGSATDSLGCLSGSATGPLMLQLMAPPLDLSSSLGGSATGPLKLHVMAPPRIRYQAWVAPPPNLFLLCFYLSGRYRYFAYFCYELSVKCLVRQNDNRFLPGMAY